MLLTLLRGILVLLVEIPSALRGRLTELLRSH